MLNSVPAAINRASRIVTLRHPNGMECTIWRKTLNRTGNNEVGGIANIGGLGVLNGEDEADYSYEPIGDGRIVMTGQYSDGTANWNDKETGLVYAGLPVVALIEFLDDKIEDHPQKDDIVSVEPGCGFVLQYGVMGEEGTVNIPPYTRRYILGALSNSDLGIG